MSRHSWEDQPYAGPQTHPLSDRPRKKITVEDKPILRPQQCDFCPRVAFTTLHRYRNTPIRKLLGMEPRTAHVCASHIGRGLDYIRKGK